MPDFSESATKNLFLKPRITHEDSAQETELRRAAFEKLQAQLIPLLQTEGISQLVLMLTGSVSEGRAHAGSDIDLVVKYYETTRQMEESVVMGIIRKKIVQLKGKLAIPYQFNLHSSSEQQGAINVQSLLRKVLDKRVQ